MTIRGNEEEMEYIKIAIEEGGSELKRQILLLIEASISEEQEERYRSEAAYIIHLKDDMDRRLAEYRNN